MRRLVLFLFLLLLPVTLTASKPPILLVVKEVNPDRSIKVQAMLPVYFELSGEADGLVKGEIIRCKIVSHKDTSRPGTLEQTYELVCNDQYHLSMRRIYFDISQ